MINRLARFVFYSGLRRLRGGSLSIADLAPRRFGDAGADLEATLRIHRDRAFTRALTAADIGLGEAYVDGDWDSPDLVPLVRLMIRNVAHLEPARGVAQTASRLVGLLAHRLRDNTVDGSRRNIHRHYDLGNEFFRLFLDERHLMYSCAYYEPGPDCLERAQERKIEHICRKLNLKPTDRILEIGTGWGGFAVWAATHCGCHVTTTTISDRQFDYAREWVKRLGPCGSRIAVLNSDYRELTGRFDKIVSIEMFEAVGLNHYDEYLRAVDRLLAPGGQMLLQTITVPDDYFPRYRASPNWIEKHIFPGGELASVGEIAKSLARSTSLAIEQVEAIGLHYARTLREWRARFLARLDDVRKLGFDDRFIRTWNLYLSYCEAAFLERHTDDVQLVIARPAA